MNPLPTLPFAFLLFAATLSRAVAYDPLDLSSDASFTTLDLVVEDLPRSRSLPVLFYLPSTTEAAPVVLFSHGLGGSRNGSSYLGKHWAMRGYVAVFLQHPGSDESVWRDLPRREIRAAMEEAASVENFRLRAEDVSRVLDQLALWNLDRTHPLFGRLITGGYGMAGHSFGAKTTQALGGESFGDQGPVFLDTRIVAALPMSPSTRPRGYPEEDFGEVFLPWMLMTGTEDTAPIGQATVQSRLAVFPALPEGDKYELVLDGAKHSAFTERDLPGFGNRRNPNHHRAILALSTAFWDAYVLQQPEPLDWLQGNGPATVLEPDDQWQWK